MGVGRLGLMTRPPMAQREGMEARAPGMPEVRAEHDAVARGEVMAAHGERLRAMGGEEGRNSRS